MPIVYAAGPMWTFTPQTATSVEVLRGATGTVQYTVTNQSSRARSLVLLPTTGLSQAAACNLAPKGSPGSDCTLTININGNDLLERGIHGGPVVCQADSSGSANPNQCYQPTSADVLQVTTRDPCPSVPATYGLGSYHFNLSGTFFFGVLPLGSGDYQIEQGSNKCERSVKDLAVYPAFGQFTPIDFVFTLNDDGTITYPLTSLRVWCMGPPVIAIKPSSVTSTYNARSDASFNINVLIDESSCACDSFVVEGDGAYIATLGLNKSQCVVLCSPQRPMS